MLKIKFFIMLNKVQDDAVTILLLVSMHYFIKIFIVKPVYIPIAFKRV